MTQVTSFSPIANQSAQILILGSMPGVLSLKANQYYAHPRNGFWPIMASIYGFKSDIEYDLKVASLVANKIAVWDVLQCCVRQGSLDSSIVNGSRVANDFKAFFELHPNIKLIAFNGLEAEKSFKTLVLKSINSTTVDLKDLGLNQTSFNDMNYVLLPSTSPANTQSLQSKMDVWKKALVVSS